MEERLQSFLARAGISSRRKAEEIIRAGRIKVDGKVVREKGFKVDPAINKITLDGRPLEHSKRAYYIVNKPKGYTSTVSDPHAEKTVLDIVPDKGLRLYPVGRLDKDSTGLIILTNDGDLAQRLTHPSFEVRKVYEVRVKGRVSDGEFSRLEKGIELEDGLTAPAKAHFLSRDDRETLVKIEIHEGRKRQIRRMFTALGHPVIDLKRVAFGGLELGDLKEGKFRKLNGEEISSVVRRS